MFLFQKDYVQEECFIILLFFFKEMCFDIFFLNIYSYTVFFPYTIDSFKYLFAYNTASIIKDTSIKHYIQTINYF